MTKKKTAIRTSFTMNRTDALADHGPNPIVSSDDHSRSYEPLHGEFAQINATHAALRRRRPLAASIRRNRVSGRNSRRAARWA
jgi:hypothetical protein